MKLKNILTDLRAKNYKAFSLFLSLTFILWFVIQMTKTYTLQSEVTINIDEVPKHIILDSLDRKNIVTITAPGLKAWKYNISDHSVNVKYKQLRNDSMRVFLSKNALVQLFSKKLDIDNTNIKIDEDLSITYRKRDFKYIPVRPDIQVQFSSGYNTVTKINVEPDSVMLTGPDNLLSSLSFLKTEKIRLKDVNKDIDIIAKIILPEDGLEVESERVRLFQQIEKFSENSISVDVKVINKPDSLELNIFPQKAKVSFLVSLKNYDKISKLDFEVICDYKLRFKETGVMIPAIRTHPENIINPKLNIKKIDYLIKK